MITAVSYGLYRLVWRNEVYWFASITEAAIHLWRLDNQSCGDSGKAAMTSQSHP